MKAAYRFATLTLRSLAWIIGSAMTGIGMGLMAVGEEPGTQYEREKREMR